MKGHGSGGVAVRAVSRWALGPVQTHCAPPVGATDGSARTVRPDRGGRHHTKVHVPVESCAAGPGHEDGVGSHEPTGDGLVWPARGQHAYHFQLAAGRLLDRPAPEARSAASSRGPAAAARRHSCARWRCRRFHRRGHLRVTLGAPRLRSVQISQPWTAGRHRWRRSGPDLARPADKPPEGRPRRRSRRRSCTQRCSSSWPPSASGR
jgi:hypothetical protein